MTHAKKHRSPRDPASAPQAEAGNVDSGQLTPAELAALMQATHGDPFAVLGPHQVGDRLVLRTLLPDALAVTVIDAAGQPLAELARQDDSALFTGALPPGTTRQAHRLRVRDRKSVV